MRRAVAVWVFVPVACLAAFVFSVYIGSSDRSTGITALLHGSTHATKTDALMKQFHNDVKQVVHADHALHAVASASLPRRKIPKIVAQHESESADAAPAEAVRMSMKDGPSSPRRNRPRVAQHFVQLARQWVARVEPLQHKLASLQHELAVYDRSVALVKQRLSEAESQRDAVKAVIQSSLHSVLAAKRLLKDSHAEKLALQHKLVHVANQISAASASFEAGKAAAADAALKYSLAQERVDPTPEDELARRIANGRAPSAAVADALVPQTHARDLAIINSAIDSRETKHAKLDEYGEQPDDQPFHSSWKPMK